MCKNKKICIAIVAGLATIGAIVVAKAIKNTLDTDTDNDVKAWSSGFFMPGYDDTDSEN